MTSKPDGTTHAEGCHRWGPRHYDCAAREIERLERELAEAWADIGRIVSAYDAYRRRGVMPAPTEYEVVVKAIEAARRADADQSADQPEGER